MTVDLTAVLVDYLSVECIWLLVSLSYGFNGGFGAVLRAKCQPAEAQSGLRLFTRVT